jgi:small subunit ribosomal protein S4
VRAKSQNSETIANSLSTRNNQYSWLEWDNTILAGKIVMNPDRSEIPENIQEQLIVELYSK